MHKETVEMTILSSMSKPTLIFGNNNTICTEIVPTKQSQNKIICNENIKNSNIKKKYNKNTMRKQKIKQTKNNLFHARNGNGPQGCFKIFLSLSFPN